MSHPPLRVSPATIPGQRAYRRTVFPFVMRCESSAGLGEATAWLGATRDELLAKAALHGVVLFRGFPVATAEAFDAFVAAFALPNFPYYESLSNAVRVNRTPRVFTANEAPPAVTIFLHHEMAQTPVYPSKLFFFCEQPAASGGATPVCRSDVLWERLSERQPDFARACAEKGLRYSHVMPAENDAASGMGRSWQSTLRATTREQAETRLRELGYTGEWQADGGLRATTPVLPAVRKLADGRVAFFNQLIAAYHGWKDTRNDPSRAVTFGDGTPLDRDGARATAELGEELAFDVAWETGDVALVDNFVAMHGRRTFTGTRKVLASLIGPEA
jgi:alpha-ketoglutarate-dependent taurine dioxygenase